VTALSAIRPKGFGLPIRPLTREDKAKLMARARSFVKRTVKGKAYGRISAKALQVFWVLLYQFHNSAKGACFPSYEKIMAAAGCCRDTVANAITALESCGLVAVTNRLVRFSVDDPVSGSIVRRVFRTSNAYLFGGGNSEITQKLSTTSKSAKQTQTEDQFSLLALQESISALGKLIRKRSARPG